MPIEDGKHPKATIASDVRGENMVEGTVSKVRPPAPPLFRNSSVVDFNPNALPCFCLLCLKNQKLKLENSHKLIRVLISCSPASLTR